MEYINTDIKEIFSVYEQLTKKQVIYENSVLPAGGQINIIIENPVPVKEAVQIIEKTLLINGIYLVPVEHSNLVIVFGQKPPASGGVPIFEDEAEIPEGDMVVSYLLHLRFADPLEVQQSLQTLFGNVGSVSQVLPLPKAGAILFTDATPRLRTLIRLAKSIDQPDAPAVSEFIQLERADAKDVLERLEKLFEKNQQDKTSTVTSVRQPVPAQPVVSPDGTVLPPGATAAATGPNSVEITSGSLTEGSLIVGKIRMTADARTNRIFIVTRDVNLPFIRKLLHEFDRDVRFGEPAVRPLRFVSAGDILDTIVKAIAEPGQKVEEAGAGGAQGNRPQNGGRTGGTTGGASTNSSGSNGSFGGSNGSGGGAQLAESLDTGERDTIPETRVVGTTKIIADKRSNAIIVLGNEDRKAKVLAIVDQLDVRAPQVRLNTVIGELTLSKDDEFGVNYVLKNGNRLALRTPVTAAAATTGTTTGTTGTTGTTTAQSGILSSAFGFPGANPAGLSLGGLLGNSNVTQALTAGAGGFSGFVTAGNAFNALVNALESTSRFHVVSRPSIFTSNNKKAVISSGEEIAIPTNINSGFSGSSTINGGLVSQSSVEYRDVALSLEVLPLINSDREVYLDIVQKDQELTGQSTNVGGNSIPTLSSQVLKTSVTVPNYGTLVLGGLIKVNKTHSTSGLPILSRIPLLGALFRSTSDTKTRTELVILIRPEVSWSPREDLKSSERDTDFLKLEPDLESTLYPENLRKKDPQPAARPALRKPAVDLRQQDGSLQK